MADMSYKPLDEFEDDDPTEEFEILLGHVTEPDGVTQAANSIHVANQALEFQQLDEEIRAANDGVCELSSELRSRKEMMVSIQRELDQLRDFSEFLEKEVELGKGAVSDVTDELVSVRAQQNDVSEQLRRRNRQIAALRDKLAEKEVLSSSLPGGRTSPIFQTNELAPIRRRLMATFLPNRLARPIQPPVIKGRRR